MKLKHIKELTRFFWRYKLKPKAWKYYPTKDSLFIDTDNPQKAIKKLAKSSHYIDLRFRDGGKYKFVQADFLREYLTNL